MRDDDDKDVAATDVDLVDYYVNDVDNDDGGDDVSYDYDEDYDTDNHHDG